MHTTDVYRLEYTFDRKSGNVVVVPTLDDVYFEDILSDNIEGYSLKSILKRGKPGECSLKDMTDDLKDCGEVQLIDESEDPTILVYLITGVKEVGCDQEGDTS